MPLPQPLLYSLIGSSPIFSKQESIFLEAELLIQICNKLQDFFKKSYKEYFRFLKLNTVMENAMMEENFVRCLVHDILSTEEYTIEGIARYTDIPQDVIFEMAAGNNPNPSLQFLKRIVDLHRSIRPQIYQDLMNKLLKLTLDLEATLDLEQNKGERARFDWK